MKVTNCLFCGDGNLSRVTQRSDNNGILKCPVCGLMMVENISDNTEELYTADYFQKSSGTKSGYTDYLSSPVANIIGKYALSHLFAKQPGTHLDLGCADGSLIEIFASEGFDSYGLEISKDAVEIANTKGLNVQFSTLAAFPKNLPKFNVITAFDLLEHADKPRVVLTETYRNLADDGYFVFSTLSVKRNDPTDYWFNNSLEHYVYFNKDSLTYALNKVFGEGSFAFAEIEINGVAEFWGVAKKGTITWESQIMDHIAAGAYDKSNAQSGYLVSLFYNQLSKFSASERIIKHFQPVWPQIKSIQATFYNQYFQGKFELAVEGAKATKHLVPATSSIYWQALCHAEEVLFEIKQKDLTRQSNEEIITLREQVFGLKDELHRIKSFPVLGRVVKARLTVGPAARATYWNLRHNAGRVWRKFKWLVGRILPGFAKKAIKRLLHYDYRARLVTTKLVTNKLWPTATPLFSVVIPYFNRADTVDDTILSLQSQTFTNFEIIIVDDGSTDPVSSQKLADLEASGLRANFIHQSNRGVSAARNTGVSKARGKYVICLDSDDMLEPTFIEKCALVMETTPGVSLVTTDRVDFGVLHEPTKYAPYDPVDLYRNNMVITAAAFRKDAWRVSGGYKADIGYEDWEFWLNLSEHGFWGKQIPEVLFKYRTSMQSRFIEDKDVHWNSVKTIRTIHSKYKNRVARLVAKRQLTNQVVEPKSALLNLSNQKHYLRENNGRPTILITIPWMTFGGAETLIYNYCREVMGRFNIVFATGLKTDHVWEYKFKEISPNIYHLANLFEDQELYLEFISNYISTRNVQILHIIHNGFTFDMLAELKRRFPNLKVAVTLFNDRAAYFEQSLKVAEYIDIFSADNAEVTKRFKREVPGSAVKLIPNGINCYEEFSPNLFDRAKERAALGFTDKNLAIMFVGRLSEEKNPNVFMEVARDLIVAQKSKHVKFLAIGDGPMRGEVEKAVAEIGSSSAVYLGYKPITEVARYLSAADVFVLPSSIEGFPLSILEAMAMATVVVASDVGAVSQVIDTGVDGFVVAPGSASEIMSVIKKLVADPTLMNTVKKNARDKVEKKYSNTILGQNYTRFYKEMLH